MSSKVWDFVFKTCSLSLLHELAGESSYWESVLDFLEENKDVGLDELSPKQKRWAEKIVKDLIAEASKDA